VGNKKAAFGGGSHVSLDLWFPLRSADAAGGYMTLIPAFTFVLVFMAFSFHKFRHRSHVSIVRLFPLLSAAAAGGYRPLHDFDTGLHTRLGFHRVLLSLSSLSLLSIATCRPKPCQTFRLAKVLENKDDDLVLCNWDGLAGVFTNRMVSDDPPKS
jgi:hypothetical protein